MVADLSKEVGRGRKVQDSCGDTRYAQHAAQHLKISRRVSVDSQIVEMLCKVVEKVHSKPLWRHEIPTGPLYTSNVMRTGQVLAGHADNATGFAQVTISMPVVQRGQELSHREVASAAKKYEVNGLWKGHCATQ